MNTVTGDPTDPDTYAPEKTGTTRHAASQTGISYLVQPFVPNHGDIRIYVLHGEVITAQHRVRATSFPRGTRS